MPTLRAAIEVDDSAQLAAHGYVTHFGERSAWVDLNAFDRDGDLDAPFLGRELGELSLYGSPQAMRQLAEAILLAVHDAERLPIPADPKTTRHGALVVAAA
jgi:hypothetical protein